MRVLWIVSGPVGKFAELTGGSVSSGGWIDSLIGIMKQEPVDFCLATTWETADVKTCTDGNFEYVLLPGGYPISYKYDSPENIRRWQNLITSFRPDVIHIHGTEYPLGLSAIHACPDQKYLVSIQGLCSIIARYYYAGISYRTILSTITLRDIYKVDTIIHARRQFIRRGLMETSYLKKVSHVTGRTVWDKTHVLNANPGLNYHHCNECLRNEFYDSEWDINRIVPFTIFTGQSEYPIKGLHMLIKALSIVKKKYNNVLLNIPGNNITRSAVFDSDHALTGYGKYLKKLIKEYSLENNVVFKGFLNSHEMSSEYCKAHVFICASSIENSSNSIGEAQLTGTPVIASYVGGNPEMIEHGKSGLLYRFEEYEMLAFYIMQIFENDLLALKISEGAKSVARKRHDRTINKNTMLEIYNKING